MAAGTPHVLSSKTVTAPTGLYRLNRYELFDVMSFLDRGSLHSLTLVSYKFGAQLERWPDDACLIPKVHITFRFDASRRGSCCCSKRKRPAKKGRCRFHFGCSTWQDSAGYKQVDLCLKKADKALKLMQHALHVSAAETVSVKCRPTLPIAWFNMFNDLHLRQIKSGRIERLVIAADFSAVHPAVFERLPFLSGEITTIDLSESTGISGRHLSDVFFRRCIGRGVQCVKVPGTKYDLEKEYEDKTRSEVDFKKTCAPEKRKNMQARLSICDQRRLSKAPEIVQLVEEMNRRVSEFAL